MVLSDVVSVEKALEICGDMEFLLEMVDLFLEDLQECIPLLGKSHAKRDTDDIKKLSHRIKGQALTLSCADLSRACLELESSASSGNYSDEEYGSVMRCIHEFIRCARKED